MLEDWQKWFAFIAGDIVLLASLFALARRGVTNTIKTVMKDELAENSRHAASTDSLVQALTTSGVARDETLMTLTETLNKVVYQVEPNRGGSLRDSVVRTETAVREMDSKIDSQIERLEVKITERMDRLDDEVTSTRDRVSTVEGQLRDR